MLLRTRVDGPWAWLVVAASFFVYLFSVGFQYLTGIFFKEWLKERVYAATSPADLAWATSLEGTLFLLGSVAAGKLIVRTSCSVTTAVGAGVLLLGALAAAYIDAPAASAPASLAVLYVFFGVTLGLGTSLVHVAAIVSVQPFFRAQRGLATGVTVAGSGVGAFTLGPTLETLVATRGWRVALAAYGVATCAVCCVAAGVTAAVALEEGGAGDRGRAVLTAARGDTPAAHGGGAKADSESGDTAAPATTLSGCPQPAATAAAGGAAATAADEAPASPSWRGCGGAASPSGPSLGIVDDPSAPPSGSPPTSGSGGGDTVRPRRDGDAVAAHATVAPSYHGILREPFFRQYAAFIVVFALAWFTIPTFLPVTVRDGLGGGSSDVSAVVAAHGVANTVGRVVMGVVTDRLPAHKVRLLAACMVVAACGSLGFTLSGALGYAYAYGAIVGGFGGAIVSIQPAVIIDYLGLPALPLVQGAVNGIQAPFALAGAPIGGALRAATGGYSATWAFVTACFSGAFLLATRIRGGAAASASARRLASAPQEAGSSEPAEGHPGQGDASRR